MTEPSGAADPDTAPDGPRDSAGPRRRWGRYVLLAIVLFAVWTGFEVWRLASQADAAQPEVQAAVAAADNRDLPGAIDRLVAAGAHTEKAAAAANSIPLRMASIIPILGHDVRAVRTVVTGADDLLRGSVLPLAKAGQVVYDAQTDQPPGTISVAAIAGQQDTVREAASVAASAKTALTAVRPGGLLVVGDRIDPVRTRLLQVADGVAAVEPVFTVLPQALGADGPRRYLMVFQNLAEERPTGGIFGSWAVITVTDGSVSFGEAGPNDVFGDLRATWQQAPADVQALYGADLGRDQNVNLSPDFPVGAALISDLWRQRSGTTPDGVIAVTPVALANLLRVTGPVQVPGGPAIGPDNAVQVLQGDVYATFADNNDLRTAYLSAVTGTVMAKALSAPFTPALASALADSVRDGHVMAWLADPAAERALSAQTIAGALPAPVDEQVRLYLTNIDASKLGQYTKVGLTTRCDPGPVAELSIDYQPPAAVVDYVRGQPGRTPALSHQLQVGLYLPPTRGVSAVTVNGTPVTFGVGTEKDWSVVRFPVQIDPGTTLTVRAELSGSPTLPTTLTQPLTRAPQVTSMGGQDGLTYCR